MRVVCSVTAAINLPTRDLMAAACSLDESLAYLNNKRISFCKQLNIACKSESFHLKMIKTNQQRGNFRIRSSVPC